MDSWPHFHRDPRPGIDLDAGASEGCSRVGGIQAIPRVVEDLGFDPAEVLAEVGIEACPFDDPSNRIRDTLIGQVADDRAARTECEHLAFRVGQRARLASSARTMAGRAARLA